MVFTDLEISEDSLFPSQTLRYPHKGKIWQFSGDKTQDRFSRLSPSSLIIYAQLY